MNKHDLIVRIVQDTGVSKRLASKMVATALASMPRALKKGDPVTPAGRLRRGELMQAYF